MALRELRTGKLIVLARVLIRNEQRRYLGVHEFMVGVIADCADTGIEGAKVPAKRIGSDRADLAASIERALRHQPLRCHYLHVASFAQALKQPPLGYVISEVIARPQLNENRGPVTFKSEFPSRHLPRQQFMVVQ